MTKTVYADILFTLNFIIDYLLLFLTARITASEVTRLRLLLSATLGALYAVLTFIPKLFFFTYFTSKLLFLLPMIVIAFGQRNFLRNYFTFFISSAALAGVCLLLPYIFKNSVIPLGFGIYYANLSAPLLIFASAFTYFLMRIIFSGRGDSRKKFCEVTVKNLGKSITLRALCDTGNSLTSASLNGRVIISDYISLRKILPSDATAILDSEKHSPFYLSLDKLSDISSFGVIPYKTVGVSFSLLLTYRPEKIYIDGHLSKNAICAISESAISCTDGYNALV